MSTNVYDILDSIGLSYEVHEHEAVFTVEESNKLYDHIPGSHTKNLFLKNREGLQFYLYIIESHKRADLKVIAEVVHEKKLHFASPEELMEYLALTPGSVSTLGLINDREHRVKVIIDRALWESDYINAHPNTNTATLTFPQSDFHKFFEWSGHEYILVDAH